ncbi:hypothetical protein [Sansalvadorimonas verongulae]|uniref:hypothetical protein n=1 Tax=Sansalvadorimonas verongulae TaxID=2172824 RepID=UPI0012BCDB43|nr:hypothetical protein [Sansalvadorimonas verongulae]MTI13350.1 hypothetical protein [Sansalvadorimonas verongulae]
MRKVIFEADLTTDQALDAVTRLIDDGFSVTAKQEGVRWSIEAFESGTVQVSSDPEGEGVPIGSFPEPESRG